MRHVYCLGALWVILFCRRTDAPPSAMALWSYFGERRSFRGTNNNVSGRRPRGRSISETHSDVLEDVEEENHSADGSPGPSSGSPTTSVNEGSLPSSYQSDQGSVRSGSALFRRWIGRTRSVDESVSSSPDRGELLPDPVIPNHQHPVFQPRQRVRHSSAPFPTGSEPARRDSRFIDRSLIDVKQIVHENGSNNGHIEEVDVWIPRIRSVYRKVL